MAVKKVTKVDKVDKVDEVKEEAKEEKVVSDLIPPIENDSITENDAPKVEVKINTNNVDDTKKPEKSVRIKMLVDHKCNIGKERYSLKKGQTYSVPLEVKMRLAKAGVLAPL